MTYEDWEEKKEQDMKISWRSFKKELGRANKEGTLHQAFESSQEKMHTSDPCGWGITYRAKWGAGQL